VFAVLDWTQVASVLDQETRLEIAGFDDLLMLIVDHQEQTVFHPKAMQEPSMPQYQSLEVTED
jgi:hypothetical protein